MLNNSAPTLLCLIQLLCESLMEPLLAAYCQLQRDFDKSIKMYDSKLNKVTQLLKNTVIKLNNERLRSKNSLGWQ